MEDSEEVNQVFYPNGQLEMEESHDMGLYQDLFSVFPLNSATTVSQPVDYYKNLENLVCPQDSLQFQGLTGPTHQPPNNSPTSEYSINLQNSNDAVLKYSSEDSHLYDTHQSVPYYGSSESSCLPLVPETAMVCGTNNSYQNTDIRARAQAEEGSCQQQKIIRKPTGGTRVPSWKEPQNTVDIVPERKKTTPINPAYAIRKSRISNSIFKWPFRDRIIHLLALKDYNKPDLLIRLQKDGIREDDQNALGRILHEVAILKSDFSYSLKGCFFTEIRKDWPGYSSLERQSLELVLANKVQPVQKSDSNTHPQFVYRDDTLLCSQDQSSNPAIIDPLRKRKIRISHLATARWSTPNSHCNNNQKPAVVGPPPSATAVSSTPPPKFTTTLPILNPQPVCSSYNSQSTPGGPGTQHDNFRQNSLISTSNQDKSTNLKKPASTSAPTKYRKCVGNTGLRSKNKLKRIFLKYRVNNPMYNMKTSTKENIKAKKQREGTKSNPGEEIKMDCNSSGTTPEFPDYLTKYVTIVTSEQRWHFGKDFNTDYVEYQTLYAKMTELSRIFFQLDAEREQLSPGSKEYQDINEIIKLEYQKLIQLNPNFREEKRRCLYLYDKLSHIKKLVNDYDQQQQLMESNSGNSSPE